MQQFDGKLAFIPGGSSGIGLAVAQRLAARGADVVILARHVDALRAASEAIRRHCRRGVQRVEWRQLDVADAAQVHTVLAAAVAELGAIDPQRCRESVAERYDVAIVADGYEAVYNSALRRAERVRFFDRPRPARRPQAAGTARGRTRAPSLEVLT